MNINFGDLLVRNPTTVINRRKMVNLYGADL